MFAGGAVQYGIAPMFVLTVCTTFEKHCLLVLIFSYFCVVLIKIR